MKIHDTGIIIFIILLAVIIPQTPLTAREADWDTLRTGAQYYDSLTAADSAAFVREFEYPFIVLLDEVELDLYHLSGSLDEKKYYIRAYWKRNNPNPLENENQWLRDFIERLQYTKKYFTRDRPPYFDDRGKYYLKYGRPRDRYTDHKTVVHRGRNVSFKRPDETWSYEDIYPDLIVHFRKDFSYYEELTPFQSFSIKLLQDRAYMSPLIREVLEPYGGGGTLMLKTRQRIARAEAPVAVREPDTKERSLAFISDINQFKGPEGATRVEFSFLVPLKKNLVENVSERSDETVGVEYSALLRNLDYDPVIRVQTSKTFPLQSAAKADLPNAVQKLSLIAPPQTGELTLQIKNMFADSIGFSQQLFEIRDYTSDTLMMSDIQLYSHVENADQRAVAPYSVKEEFLAAPYLYEHVQKSKPPILYYEMYNLLAYGTLSEEYEIEIKVEWDESREALVTKLFDFLRRTQKYSVSTTHTRTFIKNSDNETISFDLSGLRSGPYTLTVTVTNMSNETINTSVSKDIVIVD